MSKKLVPGEELKDYTGDVVGLQISPLGDKVWLCIDGVCRVRITRIGELHLDDMGSVLGKIKKGRKRNANASK